MDGAIHVKVFGVHVPRGKTVPLKAEESDSTMETFQITQVSLGENAGTKRSVVHLGDGTNEWVIGSLIPGKCEQFQTDYMGRQSISLRHTGDGDVYVSGFKTITSLDDFEEEDDDDDDDDDDEQAGEENEEQAEDQVNYEVDWEALGKDKFNMKARSLTEYHKKQQLLAAAAAEADANDDDDEDDDDDDEGLNGQDFDMEDDDDDDDEEEEDDDDDDEEEEDDEPPPPKKGAAAKRPAPAAADKAAKKAKGGAPSPEDEYAATLKKFLAKNGPQSLSALGSKITTKPANIKLKTFIKQRSDLFSLGDDGTVKLA